MVVDCSKNSSIQLEKGWWLQQLAWIGISIAPTPTIRQSKTFEGTCVSPYPTIIQTYKSSRTDARCNHWLRVFQPNFTIIGFARISAWVQTSTLAMIWQSIVAFVCKLEDRYVSFWPDGHQLDDYLRHVDLRISAPAIQTYKLTY